MHQDLVNLIGAIGIASLITSVYLFNKMFKNFDIMILGAIFPRILLFLSATWYYFAVDHSNLFPIYISILTIFISDTIIWIAGRQTEKYKEIIETNKQLDALKKLESKFYLTMENIQTGTYIIDENGKFEYTNPMFCKITGYSKSELLGKSVYDLSNESEHPKIRESILSKILGHSLVTDLKTEIKTKDGKTVKLRAISARTENGHPTITGTVMVINDEEDG